MWPGACMLEGPLSPPMAPCDWALRADTTRHEFIGGARRSRCSEPPSAGVARCNGITKLTFVARARTWPLRPLSPVWIVPTIIQARPAPAAGLAQSDCASLLRQLSPAADMHLRKRWAAMCPTTDIRDPFTKTESLGIVRGFQFRHKFSTPVVQYLCTLPPMREGGFTGAATP